jgi:hypothetical protein
VRSTTDTPGHGALLSSDALAQEIHGLVNYTRQLRGVALILDAPTLVRQTPARSRQHTSLQA